MSTVLRLTLQYLLGLALPFAIITAGPPGAVRPIAAYLFFLCIALTARFSGFGPAVACTGSAAIALWFGVLRGGTHPQSVQVTRVLLFLAAAFVVATVSRQRAKESREAEERLHALFDRAIDAMIFFDANGRCVDANPAAMQLLGIERTDFGKYQDGDRASAAGEVMIRQLQRLVDAGMLTGEWTVQRVDGTTREVEYRYVPDILPGLHLIVSHDITARKTAEHSLRQLSTRLLQLQDEERARIARQLHDTTAQSLAAMRMHLVRIDQSGVLKDGPFRDALAETLALTDQSIAEIRTLSYLLHPPMIEAMGLGASLRWYTRGFEDRSGIRTELEAPDELARLPKEFETAVFRIVQEALTNIQRHSGSSVARVRLSRTDRELCVSIEDEGRGLPHALRGDGNALRSAGVGMAGMEHRARELGGKIDVHSSDRGTRLEVTLPFAET
ncbi:MAG TPA: ATP-binding protein [Thermoanaerobaculia bacterium]|nr:ATP-binding protein [Thermoanaerobaculia bacterium]